MVAVKCFDVIAYQLHMLGWGLRAEFSMQGAVWHKAISSAKTAGQARCP